MKPLQQCQVTVLMQFIHPLSIRQFHRKSHKTITKISSHLPWCIFELHITKRLLLSVEKNAELSQRAKLTAEDNNMQSGPLTYFFVISKRAKSCLEIRRAKVFIVSGQQDKENSKAFLYLFLPHNLLPGSLCFWLRPKWAWNFWLCATKETTQNNLSFPQGTHRSQTKSRIPIPDVHCPGKLSRKFWFPTLFPAFPRK